MGKGIVDLLKKEYDIREEWVGYELHPETPVKGILYSELFKGRDFSAMRAQIRKRGEQFGLVFGERALLSNTKMVLQAAEFARDEGVYEAFHEAVFRAYFSEGRDIGDPEVIAAMAVPCGIDAGRMMAAVESGHYLPRLEAARREGDSLGLTGIPLFLINSRFQITGAQDPDVFRKAFERLEVTSMRS